MGTSKPIDSSTAYRSEVPERTRRLWCRDFRSALLALLVAALASPAMGQEKTFELKLSHWVPASHPLQKALEDWGAAVEKESGGTIKYKVYPSQQLGKAFDHYDMARDGIADLTYVNPGYQPGRFPIIAAGQLPFTFGDGKKGTLALDEWYRKYAPKEMKDTKFCFAFIHDPGALHGKKKIVAPTDLAGTKVRPAQSTIAEMVRLLGGTNVQASAPEARDALERGVADEITFPWGSIFLFGIDKVVKYHMDVPLYTTVFTYNINLDTYNSMSPAQKKVMDDHCTPEWAAKVSDPWADFEAAGRDQLRKEPGHEVYAITPEQLALWRKAAAPLQQQWADKVKAAGFNPDEVFGELKASLAKHESGY